MDSEDEGVFTVSCAGGARADCCLPIRRQRFGAPVQEIAVTGLVGGHSGAEIDKGRANSSMLLGRVLCALEQKTPLRVISVSGGLKDNAIPTASVALVAADAGRPSRPSGAEMDAAFKKEYRVNDPAITVSARPAESSLLPMDEASSRSAVCLLGLPAQRHPGHERRHARPGPDLSESGASSPPVTMRSTPPSASAAASPPRSRCSSTASAA